MYLSARTWHTAPDWDGAWDAPLGRHGNLLRRPELGALLPDGGVTWAYDCPSVPRVDTVIYATGGCPVSFMRQEVTLTQLYPATQSSLLANLLWWPRMGSAATATTALPGRMTARKMSREHHHLCLWWRPVMLIRSPRMSL